MIAGLIILLWGVILLLCLGLASLSVVKRLRESHVALSEWYTEHMVLVFSVIEETNRRKRSSNERNEAMGLFDAFKKPSPDEQPQAAYEFPDLREPCGYCGKKHNGGCGLAMHQASKEVARGQKRVGKRVTGRL